MAGEANLCHIEDVSPLRCKGCVVERLWCDVSSLTLLTLLAVTPSFAQTKTQTGTDPADDPGRAQATKAPVLVEEVIVTGTRITRRDFQSPSPVYTLDSDAIQLQGYPTLDDMLNRLPQFSPDYGRSMGYKEVEFGIEESSINLRGLGAERTLVLLDGKRLGAGGSHGVINTNVLPSSMMERVEVLTGGASAVYGPDAMAGVVNFITRKDFTGFELTGNYEVTARSDADVGSLNVAAGSDFADGRGNISGFIDY